MKLIWLFLVIRTISERNLSFSRLTLQFSGIKTLANPMMFYLKETVQQYISLGLLCLKSNKVTNVLCEMSR